MDLIQTDSIRVQIGPCVLSWIRKRVDPLSEHFYASNKGLLKTSSKGGIEGALRKSAEEKSEKDERKKSMTYFVSVVSFSYSFTLSRNTPPQPGGILQHSSATITAQYQMTKSLSHQKI